MRSKYFLRGGDNVLRALIIGIGQCGTKIADLFALVDFDAIALNTSRGGT